MKTIVTDRINLRPLLIDDISSEYIKALNNPEVIKLTEAKHQKWNEDNVKKYIIESNIKEVSELIGIFLNENNKHIGNIRLFNFNQRHKRVELGIMIFDKSEWHKGYGTEALKAVSEYVFKDMRFHKICADYYSLNIGSAKMFKKAGFQIEGIFKDYFILEDNYVDSVRITKINKND